MRFYDYDCNVTHVFPHRLPENDRLAAGGNACRAADGWILLRVPRGPRDSRRADREAALLRLLPYGAAVLLRLLPGPW